MTDKNKKIVKISGLCAVVVGTVAVVIAGGDVATVTGIATLAGAAVVAVGAVIAAIFA